MRIHEGMIQTGRIAAATIAFLLMATELGAAEAVAADASAPPAWEASSGTFVAVEFLTADRSVLRSYDADAVRSNAEVDSCAAPVSGRSTPLAGDCLFILRAAVHVSTCASECACAPKGTLPVSASDALLCLKSATGQSVTLNCPCSAGTSTTTSSTSTTSSTTTTLSLADIGQQIYDGTCSLCHKAGNHDGDGFAPDLAGKGNLVQQNLSSIDPQMTGIFLTADDVAAVRAFLNSL